MALKEELKIQGDFLFKHRSYLPIIVLLIGLVVSIHGKMTGQEFTGWFNNLYEIICLEICLWGALIRIITIGYASDNTSGRNTTEGQIADSINTTGMYSQCRHPLYLGNFLMWLGIAAITQNFWFIIAFCFFYCVYYERIMYAEEAFLTEKFQEPYRLWAKHTPAFIPKFKDWLSPQRPFRWRKVIKQEKSGILNLFIVLFLFHIVGEYIAKGQFEFGDAFWVLGLLMALIGYLFIKFQQNNAGF